MRSTLSFSRSGGGLSHACGSINLPSCDFFFLLFLKQFYLSIFASQSSTTVPNKVGVLFSNHSARSAFQAKSSPPTTATTTKNIAAITAKFGQKYFTAQKKEDIRRLRLCVPSRLFIWLPSYRFRVRRCLSTITTKPNNTT